MWELIPKLPKSIRTHKEYYEACNILMNKTVIVILNWNGGKTTARLLASLSAHASAYPVWVIDNGSEVDETDIMKEAKPDIEIIRLHENSGFAGGMNFAIRRAVEHGFEFVYEINNDCLVESDCVTPCLQAMENRPRLAIAGSRFKSKTASGRYEKWGFHSNPDEKDFFTNGILLCDRVVGCGMLIRCASTIEADGFDERFFCYGEETDLCWRLLELKYEIAICFESLILHDHQGSNINGNAEYYRARNAFLLHKKHPAKTSLYYDISTYLLNAWKCIFHNNLSGGSACGYAFHDGIIGRIGSRANARNLSTGICLLIGYSIVLLPIVVLYKTARRVSKLFLTKRSEPLPS